MGIFCEQFQAMTPIVYLNEPFAMDFATQKLRKHAQKCNKCMFLLSHTIALNETYFAMPKIQIVGFCPDREAIRGIFITGVFELLNNGIPRNPEKIKEELILDPEYAPQEVDAWEHCKRCRLCMEYFDELLSTLLLLQPAFESKIRRDHILRLKTDFDPHAEQTFCSGVYIPNNSKKPQ